MDDYSISLKCLTITLDYTNNPTASDYNAEIRKNNNNFRSFFIIKNSMLSINDLNNIEWWQERKLIKLNINHLNTISNGQIKEIIAQYNPITYKSGYTTFNIVMLKVKEANPLDEKFKPISPDFNITKTSFSSQNGIINTSINNNLLIKIYCSRNNLSELFDINENNNDSVDFYNMVYLDKNYLLLGERKNYINYFNFTPLLYPLANVNVDIKSNENYSDFLEITNLPLTINTGEINTNSLSLKTIFGKKDLELTLLFDSVDTIFKTFNPEFLSVNGQISNIPLDNPNVAINPLAYTLNLDLFQIRASETEFNLTDININKLSNIDISFSLIPLDLSSVVFSSQVDNSNNVYISNTIRIVVNLNSNDIFDFTPLNFIFPDLNEAGILTSGFSNKGVLSSINTVNLNDQQRISFETFSNDPIFKDLIINDLNINICSLEVLNNSNQLFNKGFVNVLNNNNIDIPIKVEFFGRTILTEEQDNLKLITTQTIVPSESKNFIYKLSLTNYSHNTELYNDTSPWNFKDSYNIENKIHNFSRIQLKDITSSLSENSFISGSGFILLKPYKNLPYSGSWSSNNDISFNGIWNINDGIEEQATFNSKESLDIYVNYRFLERYIDWKDTDPNGNNIIVEYELNEEVNASIYDFYKLSEKDVSLTDKNDSIFNNSGSTNGRLFNLLTVNQFANDYHNNINTNSLNKIIDLINFDINNNPFSQWNTDISLNILSRDFIKFDTSDPSLINKKVNIKLTNSPYCYSFSDDVEIFNDQPYFTRSTENPGFPDSFIEINFSKLNNAVKHVIIYITDITASNTKNRDSSNFNESSPEFNQTSQEFIQDTLNNFYFNQTYFIFNIVSQDIIDIGNAILQDITIDNNPGDGSISLIPSGKEGISDFTVKLNPNINYSNNFISIFNQFNTSFQINAISLYTPIISNISISRGKIIFIEWNVNNKNVYDFSNPLVGKYNVSSYFNIYRQKSGSDDIQLIGTSPSPNYTDNTAVEFTNYNYYIEGVANWQGLTLTSERSKKSEGFIFVCENNPFPSGRWNNTRENRKLYRPISNNCGTVNQSSTTPRFTGNLFPNSLNLTKKGIYKFLSDGTRRPNR